ncbi:hypothetical protein GOEFS_070_00350 [Gordonia effusa NBRC 100432]|uniref:Uncharacterized protein n=1 Tax=Gordonia effusa NBRC 100432 TaxID=1077974 RepID=H0R1K0_9ACTN|nr:hypothetical protein [Gordonia effusa]GAB18951.1 hypothetical protein GOEFS_070_00350 [Gordonia effusa NBRC 100432]
MVGRLGGVAGRVGVAGAALDRYYYAARAFFSAFANCFSDMFSACALRSRWSTTGHFVHRFDERQHFFFGFTLRIFAGDILLT